GRDRRERGGRDRRAFRRVDRLDNAVVHIPDVGNRPIGVNVDLEPFGSFLRGPIDAHLRTLAGHDHRIARLVWTLTDTGAEDDHAKIVANPRGGWGKQCLAGNIYGWYIALRVKCIERRRLECTDRVSGGCGDIPTRIEKVDQATPDV